MRIYTRTGDDGTTGLLFGGRVAKDSAVAAAAGDVDEAQAVLGMARAAARAGGGTEAAELAGLILDLQRDLWVLMAEVATAAANRPKLKAGQTLVTAEMVRRVETLIDDLTGRFEPPTEFVVPGQDTGSAWLDLARTVVRRAERRAVTVTADVEESCVVPYLNRLSDLLWTMARWCEQESLPARDKM